MDAARRGAFSCVRVAGARIPCLTDGEEPGRPREAMCGPTSDFAGLRDMPISEHHEAKAPAPDLAMAAGGKAPKSPK